MNKCFLAVPSPGYHADPAGWKLAVWNGWRGLTKVILREDPKCLGLAMLQGMPFIHLPKLTGYMDPPHFWGWVT